jgi:uncharacterized protein with PQ loop repeat
MPISSVRTRKFLCCLPARLGAFILALAAMIGGSFVAGVGIIQITGVAQAPVEKSDLIALYIQTIMYALLGVVGAFGFVGALIRNYRMVSSFAVVLAVHLGFSIASGIFSIYAMFTRDASTAVAQCLVNASVQGVEVSQTDCQNGITVMKGVMVAVYVITWLIQLYAYFIVERYADQLEEEDLANQARVVPRSLPEISAPLNQMSAYSGYNSAYPFAEGHSAFGSQGRRDQGHMV